MLWHAAPGGQGLYLNRCLQKLMIYLTRASASPVRTARWLRARMGPIRAKEARWIYLGRDGGRMAGWQAALGESTTRIGYGEELQALAWRWRIPYLEWLAQRAAERPGLDWWSSRLAERNTLLETLFHAICYLQIGLEHARDAPDVLVVGESRHVLRSIARLPKLQSEIQWCPVWTSVPDELREACEFAARWTHYALESAFELWDAWVTRPRKLPRYFRGQQKRVVIHTCLDDSYFDPAHPGRDRYYTVLPSELRARGYEVVIIPWLYNLRRSRRQAFFWFRERGGQYLLPEDHYSPADYLWAGCRLLRLAWRTRKHYHFEDLDISELLRAERWKQIRDVGIARFIQYYRLIEKLRARKVDFDIFIDTFENMMSEKPQVLAMRKWMPWVTTVGFQYIASLPPLWLNCFTTPQEAAIAPHPDIIACNSAHTRKQLLDAGFPSARLRIGASLRCLYLLAPRAKRCPEPNTVLVVLPIDALASRTLLDKVRQAFPAPEGISIWLKQHPMSPPLVSRNRAGKSEFPEHWRIVDGRIEDLLARAACAVVSVSTAAFEAALSAVPLVLVGSEIDFDINPLGWYEEFDLVTSAEDLRVRIEQLLALAPEQQAKLEAWADRMRLEAASPVSQATLAAFVEPPSHSWRPEVQSSDAKHKAGILGTAILYPDSARPA